MEPLELDGSPINPSPSTPATHLVNGTVVPVRRSSGDEHPNGEIVTEARARDPAVLANVRVFYFFSSQIECVCGEGRASARFRG